MLAFIVGTGSHYFPHFTPHREQTRYGEVEILRGTIEGTEVIVLSRHGENHERLPNHINFRANILALKQLGVTAIVGFSVAGVLRREIPLAIPAIITDLYYPDNRLPSGEICSYFDTIGEGGRGHLIMESFFHKWLNADIRSSLQHSAYRDNATYVYSIGPRFNSRSEIRSFAAVWGDYVSQTCGAEAVLAGELEIPYAQLCYWVDYANGVQEINTSMQELSANITKSQEVFMWVLHELVRNNKKYSFEGFVYRFK